MKIFKVIFLYVLFFLVGLIVLEVIYLTIILYGLIDNFKELNSQIVNIKDFFIPFLFYIIGFPYFFLPTFFLFLLLYLLILGKIVKIRFTPIYFSFFNTVICFILNTLYINENIPHLDLNNYFLWLILLSIFISPIILSRLPYFKKLMESF